MLPKKSFRDLPAYKALQSEFEEISGIHLRELFQSDENRANRFTTSVDDFHFDYSKHRIREKTKNLLIDLARESELDKAIAAQFKGEKINETEGRAVLHTALRNFSGKAVEESGIDVMPDIQAALDKMKRFSAKVISGEWKGYTGKPISDVINIGIGGSDLGPFMVTEALKPFGNHLRMHYVSNVDGSHLAEVLKKIDPETSLFLIVSKTFTTQETMANANSARKWLLGALGNELAVSKHFVAVSTQPDLVTDFGIDPENMFVFWDWVGGRYSLWSSVGLSIALSVGYDRFEELLQGAHGMDLHFQNAAFDENIPVLMALLGIWYVNFFGCSSIAILPYDQYLHRFPAYLQQGDMESNGKSVDRNGKSVDYATGPVVWGEPGTNGQHAFYQLIHQGTELIPCDFIASARSQNPMAEHHQLLLANCLAQSKALMDGKTNDEVRTELAASGKSDAEINFLAPFKTFKGNIPSSTILLRELSPRNLGKLIAAYEHKIFVQGIIWNVYSFDQWGVELGKELAKTILPDILNEVPSEKQDLSTFQLLNQINKWTK